MKTVFKKLNQYLLNEKEAQKWNYRKLLSIKHNYFE